MEIEDSAEHVEWKESFEQFLGYFLQDLKENGSYWNKKALEAFLDGLDGFVHDLQGYDKNRGENVDLNQPAWQIFVDCLLAARVYA